MGRFVNTENGVVVTVADHKDERFAAPPWRADDGTDATSDADTSGAQSAGRPGRRGRASQSDDTAPASK